MIFPHTSFPPLPAIHMSKRKGKTFFRAGALHKIFSSSVYKLSTYICPNILLQLMEWLGGLARTADPSLASHAVSCLPVSHLPTHPTNQCLPACAPTEASLERSCLPLVGRLLMFVATLPNLNNLIELNTLHRRSTAAARTNSASQCVLHNQYNHTQASTRYRSAGNLLCVSVELLQTSPWPGFALAAGQAFLLIQVAHGWSSQVWRTLCYIVSASWPLCTILLLFQPSGHSLLLVCQAVLTYDLDMVMYSHSLTETLCNMLSQWQLFARTYLMRQCVTGPEFFRCHFFR